MYVDPGMSSFFWQLLLTAVAGMSFTARSAIRRMLSFLHLRSPAKKKATERSPE